ncbi:hypothetical protein BD626DRAFT_495644 [Schizophyllum amplum]|uniref:Uncharacterized protein n=1 Tax=Schizophyllum amplum TaxID=97359 RepID=A0A550CEC0_9AGAR|nr:hypothetical protein BD626DRAFT_495644 [Auriculariopsis ampla]
MLLRLSAFRRLGSLVLSGGLTRCCKRIKRGSVLHETCTLSRYASSEGLARDSDLVDLRSKSWRDVPEKTEGDAYVAD